MQNLGHPLKDVVRALRQAILEADPAVGEEVKWNAPSFFYTGEMPPSDPKEYRRYLVVTNLHRQNEIMLVFWGGGRVHDTSGLLTGDYEDGRRPRHIPGRRRAQCQTAAAATRGPRADSASGRVEPADRGDDGASFYELIPTRFGPVAHRLVGLSTWRESGRCS